MIKENDIEKILSGEEHYEPLYLGGSGWAVKFVLPEPTDKEPVERIRNKIKDKDGKN